MKRLALLAAIALMAVYIPTDAERARWTMHDMMSWKTAFDAYKIDHKVFPTASTAEEARAAIEPMYIRHAPMTDAWGNAYRIDSNPTSFRVVSSGADGVFQADTSAPGALASFADDAVVTENGRWLTRHWDMK